MTDQTQVIRIEIREATVSNIRPYKDKQYGEQQAGIYAGGAFALPFRVNVEASHPYPAGVYTIDPQSFKTDQYNNLILKGLKLLPLGGSSKK